MSPGNTSLLGQLRRHIFTSRRGRMPAGGAVRTIFASPPLASLPWTTRNGRSRRPSGCCAELARRRGGRRPLCLHRTEPGRYPWQWYWDSCFAAIANRRFEPGRSRAELESLLAAQRPDGFIGHTIFWHRPVYGVRRAFYNVATRTARQTESIQPPLLAWAWRMAVGDPAAEPRIGAQADWLTANRDLEGDGLLWIVQPDESGLDASPKFEPVWGRRPNGRAGFPLLVERNRRLGWDARRIRDRGGPVLCETLVNTLWSLSLQSLGRPSATPALVERLWDERRGLFVDEAQPGGLRPARSPGRASRRWRCPTCRRRSAGAWSRSTC